MHLLECKWCKKSFETNHKRKYCHTKCKCAYNNSLQLPRVQWKVIRSCQYCQCEFETHNKSDKIYCNKICRDNYKHKTRRRKNVPIVKCANPKCDNTFKQTRKGHKYCNLYCKAPLKPDTLKTCIHIKCGKDFKTTVKGNKKTCSHECLHKSRYGAFKCRHCHKWFKSYRSDREKHCCSLKCHRTAYPNTNTQTKYTTVKSLNI